MDKSYKAYIQYIISLYGNNKKGMVDIISKKLYPIEEETKIHEAILEFPDFQFHKVKRQSTKTLETFINEEKLRIEKELIRNEANRREREDLQKLHQYQAYSVYNGSNGGATRGYLSSLEKQGHYGKIAAALFRTQKSSTRAKMYRGSKYTGMAYEKKNEVMQQLCNLLNEDSCGLIWGW